MYYGGDFSNSGEVTLFRYIVSSDRPIDIYIVPSKSDYNLLVHRGEFIHYPSCSAMDVLKYNQICSIKNTGGIVIFSKEDSKINLVIMVKR